MELAREQGRGSLPSTDSENTRTESKTVPPADTPPQTEASHFASTVDLGEGSQSPSAHPPIRAASINPGVPLSFCREGVGMAWGVSRVPHRLGVIALTLTFALRWRRSSLNRSRYCGRNRRHRHHRHQIHLGILRFYRAQGSLQPTRALDGILRRDISTSRDRHMATCCACDSVFWRGSRSRSGGGTGDGRSCFANCPSGCNFFAVGVRVGYGSVLTTAVGSGHYFANCPSGHTLLADGVRVGFGSVLTTAIAESNAGICGRGVQRRRVGGCAFVRRRSTSAH